MEGQMQKLQIYKEYYFQQYRKCPNMRTTSTKTNLSKERMISSRTQQPGINAL